MNDATAGCFPVSRLTGGGRFVTLRRSSALAGGSLARTPLSAADASIVAVAAQEVRRTGSRRTTSRLPEVRTDGCCLAALVVGDHGPDAGGADGRSAQARLSRPPRCPAVPPPAEPSRHWAIRRRAAGPPPFGHAEAPARRAIAAHGLPSARSIVRHRIPGLGGSSFPMNTARRTTHEQFVRLPQRIDARGESLRRQRRSVQRRASSCPPCGSRMTPCHRPPRLGAARPSRHRRLPRPRLRRAASCRPSRRSPGRWPRCVTKSRARWPRACWPRPSIRRRASLSPARASPSSTRWPAPPAEWPGPKRRRPIGLPRPPWPTTTSGSTPSSG